METTLKSIVSYSFKLLLLLLFRVLLQGALARLLVEGCHAGGQLHGPGAGGGWGGEEGVSEQCDMKIFNC